jgi:cyclic pyranopterin phosphate synthase
MSDELTHFNNKGDAHMVDIGQKQASNRVAIAKGRVLAAPATLQKITDRQFGKGDPLSVAQLAGIMGAKQTAQLIPLCHPLGLDRVEVTLDINLEEQSIDITAQCEISGKTGVEMEALTAVSVAALTLYDMCKSVDKSMRLTDIRLVHKSGGKSGVYNGE